MTITRRLLLHVGVGTGLVLAVVTTVTYRLVYSTLEARELQNLRAYVSERARREEARFLGVQANLLLVRGQFLKRLEAPTPPGFLERWDHWYVRYPDGAWRSREEFKDARRYASLWANRDWVDTPEHRREVLVAQELCDELLPGWVDVFPSYYFQFHGPLNIGVDTAIPDWAWGVPADYDGKDEEWMRLALPAPRTGAPPPPDRFSWTGLLKDEVTPIALVCVYLPVFYRGEFIGSVGHNLSMEGTLDDATRGEFPGAAHFIFRADGRLIAHPTLRAGILASKGLLTAEASGDAALAGIHKIAVSATPDTRRFSGHDPASDTYYSIARLAGPEWFYVTTVPRERLRQLAYASARWVLWSGLVSLGLLLVSVAAILRRQVGRPLAELARATEAMRAGDTAARARVRRDDDLGALAVSLNQMAARVAARESELRELNNGLEHRVAARTAELERALVREKELGEMKSDFVSLVSHEFRTPLGVIMSATEILGRYSERLPPEKRARHLDMIFRSGQNLSALMEEVLLLGRLEEGRLPFAPVPVQIEKLCRAVVDELHAATGGKCPLRLRLAPGLHDAVSDEALLRHVLHNLLSNAVKYSDPDSPVEFTAERVGSDLRLLVSDRGIGIPEADQARLFTSFTRGGNVGQRPGTGLGLVVVQRCVRLHGGSLHLVSAPGSGTTVTVTLPVYREPGSPSP